MIFMLKYKVQRQVVLYKEYGEEIVWNQEGILFLKQWCLQHGSTFEGRKDASMYILKCRQKVPILISEKTRDLLFPTSSYLNDACIWINYKYIQRVNVHPDGVLVQFCDDSKYVVPISIRSMKRSLNLCKKYYAYLYQ